MDGSPCARSFLLVMSLLILLACSAVARGEAQGVPLAHGQPNFSNDSGGLRGDDAIPVSSGMLAPFLPKIPNLELGFLYSFGGNVRTGRFTADYTLPFHLSPDSVVFGEAHAEGWNFWKKPGVSISAPAGFTTTASTASKRMDLSFGGGYRTVLGRNALVGVNGFYDTSRLYSRWYSSGGLGMEMAATIAENDAIDLNLNWYGNLFNRDVLVNAFRNKGNSFDLEAGYSHALFDQSLDLRLKLVGYQFDVGTPIRGLRGGADLTTRNGILTVRYEHGSDPINGDYNTIGGFINVGFNLENVLYGESPLVMPEPVFKSPRSLRRMLGLKVKRNWHSPGAVVLVRQTANGGGPPEPAPVPLFTRTAYVGVVNGPFGSNIGTLDAELTAADLVGVNSVVVTWDSGVVGNGYVNMVRLGNCAGPHHDITGASSPPGSTVTDPAFWNLLCGPWNGVTVFNASPPTDYGTVTLSFFP